MESDRRSQHRPLLIALGILVASLGYLLPDAACSSHMIGALCSRQVVSVAAFAGLLIYPAALTYRWLWCGLAEPGRRYEHNEGTIPADSPSYLPDER